MSRGVRDTTQGCQLEFAGDTPLLTCNDRVVCSEIPRFLPSFVQQRMGRKSAAQFYEAYRDREEIKGYRQRPS